MTKVQKVSEGLILSPVTWWIRILDLWPCLVWIWLTPKYFTATSQLHVEGLWASCHPPCLISPAAWLSLARPGLGGDRGDPLCMHRLRHTYGQSNGGEIFWHWRRKSTCNESLGNFPKNLKDLTRLCPVHHLLGLLKVMRLFDTGSSSGTHNWAKRKNTSIRCCGLCYTGDQTKLGPAYGTLYVCTDIVCGNKITAISNGVERFPCPHTKPVGIFIILEPTTTSETVNRCYLLSSIVA